MGCPLLLYHPSNPYNRALGAIALIRLGRGFPSGLGNALFENHWGIWAALLLVGAAGIWHGLHTRNAKVRNAGVGILVMLLLWIIIAGMVVTPFERLVNANHAIIDAAARDDVPMVMKYVSKRAVFGQWRNGAIQPALAERLAAVHITDNMIRSMSVHIMGNQATVRFVIWTSTRNFGPVVTSWRLIWRDHRRPGNWRIVEADLLRVNGHRMGPDAFIPPPP